MAIHKYAAAKLWVVDFDYDATLQVWSKGEDFQAAMAKVFMIIGEQSHDRIDFRCTPVRPGKGETATGEAFPNRIIEIDADRSVYFDDASPANCRCGKDVSEMLVTKLHHEINVHHVLRGVLAARF
ncbi:hypothetical protein DLJ47_17920 [Micromonospora sp. S4605]|uniref:hypothetical protein n=1 Tax=Micromonospora sp. S4605 TaxID=1420897 RepID=UPI000D6F4033|nr:hypothetical protein [Micromonospora sp. S4605]PWU52730.1 hypothetical protein DLJ47_17920 [Micromonospora sp. S4605]